MDWDSKQGVPGGKGKSHDVADHPELNFDKIRSDGSRNDSVRDTDLGSADVIYPRGYNKRGQF